jgi:hypothetical protein
MLEDGKQVELNYLFYVLIEIKLCLFNSNKHVAAFKKEKLLII